MAKCKGCGAEILWAKNENDKMIPLDAKAPVYVLTIRADSPAEKVAGTEARCQRAEKDRAFVSHFSTCPKANEFSGSKSSTRLKKWKGLVE